MDDERDPHRDPYNIGQANRLAGDRFACGDCGYLWPILTLGTPFEFDRCRQCGGRMTAAWDVFPGGGRGGAGSSGVVVADRGSCRNCRRPIHWIDGIGWIHGELPQYAHESITCETAHPSGCTHRIGAPCPREVGK